LCVDNVVLRDKDFWGLFFLLTTFINNLFVIAGYDSSNVVFLHLFECRFREVVISDFSLNKPELLSGITLSIFG
jgi:hypothetical protein